MDGPEPYGAIFGTTHYNGRIGRPFNRCYGLGLARICSVEDQRHKFFPFEMQICWCMPDLDVITVRNGKVRTAGTKFRLVDSLLEFKPM